MTSAPSHTAPRLSHTSCDKNPVATVLAARAFAPEVMGRAEEIKSGRRLPADLAQRFAEAGMFRIALPKAFNGDELHPADIVRVIEEISRADGSAGWCVMIGGTTATLAALLAAVFSKTAGLRARVGLLDTGRDPSPGDRGRKGVPVGRRGESEQLAEARRERPDAAQPHREADVGDGAVGRA